MNASTESTQLAFPREFTDKRFARANNRESSSWQVSSLWDLHHQIVRRIFLGQKNTEIAKALNCTKEHVSTVRNSDIVKTELAKMHQTATNNAVDIAKQISEQAPKALKVLEKLMNDETVNPATRARIAMDQLDRSGNAAPKQTNILHAHLTSADIQELKKRALQLGTDNGVVVEEAEIIKEEEQV